MLNDEGKQLSRDPVHCPQHTELRLTDNLNVGNYFSDKALI